MRLKFLDSFRGLTIFAMILSGSIAFNGVLPSFMYHAQVPPPLHKFMPNIPGITWVDLVFPFFLFAMGVSIPISLQAKLKKNEKRLSIITDVVVRGIKLAWFAFFIQLIKQRVVDGLNYETSLYILISFGIAFLQYTSFAKNILQKHSSTFTINKYLLVIILFIISVVWFTLVFPYLTGTPFSFTHCDIIIMVLANVSVTGTIIYYFTNTKKLTRFIVLLLIIAFVINGKYGGGYMQTIYNYKFFNALPIFNFEFHKYLLIVLPATYIGEILLKPQQTFKTLLIVNIIIATMQVLIIIVGVIMLYLRLTDNYIYWLSMATAALLITLYLNNCGYKQIIYFGLAMLWLGILIEPLQGGIKKDSATFSYFFVTTGFACLALHAFYILQNQLKLSTGFFNIVGQNALGAYEMGKFIVYPIMVFTSTNVIFNTMKHNAWEGFLRGFVYTLLACSIAWIFSKKKLIFKA